MGTTDERKMEGLLALSDGKKSLYVEPEVSRRKRVVHQRLQFTRTLDLESQYGSIFTLKYELGPLPVLGRAIFAVLPARTQSLDPSLRPFWRVWVWWMATVYGIIPYQAYVRTLLGHSRENFICPLHPLVTLYHLDHRRFLGVRLSHSLNPFPPCHSLWPATLGRSKHNSSPSYISSTITRIPLQQPSTPNNRGMPVH